MACSTSSGMLVGPGMARNSRPARTVIVALPCLDALPCWHDGAKFQRAHTRCIHAELQRVRAVLLPHGLDNLLPDLVLDLGRQRARQDVHGLGALLAGFDQPQDPHFTIGVVQVAAAVAASERWADAGHLIFGGRHAGSFEVPSPNLALEIDVGVDVMGDGAGVMADADTAVLGCRAEPHRALLLALVQHLPVADVVAAVGIGADRLFKSEVLAPAEVIEIADRCVLVGAVEQHAADDLDGRFQRDRIGRIPARRMHRAENVFGFADQADIDGIAGNSLSCARHHRQAGKALLMLVMGPQRRQHDIGQQAVHHERDGEDGGGAAQPAMSRRARVRFVIDSVQRLVSRQPAASASSTEQNQRVPLEIFIWILAYQRLVGWWKMHSPARLTLPLMVQSGEGATEPEADASRMALALSGGFTEPRMTVFLLRTRQSHGAMKAPCHMPALASRAAFSSAS